MNNLFFAQPSVQCSTCCQFSYWMEQDQTYFIDIWGYQNLSI